MIAQSLTRHQYWEPQFWANDNLPYELYYGLIRPCVNDRIWVYSTGFVPSQRPYWSPWI